jgi:hypothetical protein
MKRLPTILCGMLLSTALQAAEPATTATPAATPSPATPPSAAQVLAPTRTATPASTPTPAATPDTAPAAAPSPGPAAATQPAGPADATAAAAGQASPPARRGASDRVELGATQITGNAELPRVMYVVPWKRTELGDLAGKPARSLLDEVLAPVDRDVFRRQVRYYEALRPDEQPKEP